MDAKARPGHRRNASSKSAILRSWVSSSSKSRPASPESECAQETTKNTASNTNSTKVFTVPLLPADLPPRVLGERHSNVQSPPQSPSKRDTASKSRSPTKKSKDGRNDKQEAPMKSKKSSSNLAAVFAKMNRSSKDVSKIVSPEKDKENSIPKTASPTGLPATPIWAQFASTAGSDNSHTSTARSGSHESRRSSTVQDEIARYTPQDYSPGKQRNFNGTLDQPGLRPTLGSSRPQSAYFSGSEGLMGAIGRRVSGGRPSMDGRRSEDSSRRQIDHSSRASFERAAMLQRNLTDRKTSGSSSEQPAKEKLSIVKRGGRVMAAVAAFQGKGKDMPPPKEKEEASLDPQTVDAAFEAVLDSRNIPEPMRQKMRTLTLRVKADFIKQDSEASKTVTPPGTVNGEASGQQVPTKGDEAHAKAKQDEEEDDSKSTKRSRPRSRTFTFSRGDRRDKGEASPAKKPRSQSKNKSRPTSIQIPKEPLAKSQNTPTTPTGSMGRKSAPPANPVDYITYLRKTQDPAKVEVGRLHKLRILLRNETVAWVDSFISQRGMAEIVGLLDRIMAIEWREEHEDQLLHETLLCLKGLCTTERAMAELDQVADALFPALLGMLFDEEKKGPAEYTTRTIIVNVLFTFLATATKSSPEALEQRARRILAYLGERPEPEDARPVDFVLTMRTSRPYKLWGREVSNVTKEVFWIFLHHLNVVPLAKPGSSHSRDGGKEESTASYTQRHFPGSRPPVPAAPYIGGVEWDATTYITAHLDLLNGLIASLPSSTARNALRKELEASGFEKCMGGVLRTCKEKFYSGVHDGLKAWVQASEEDGWPTRFVREGPSHEEIAEQALRARSASPRKKKDEAPKLDAPKLEAPKLDLDDGWLG